MFSLYITPLVLTVFPNKDSIDFVSPLNTMFCTIGDLTEDFLLTVSDTLYLSNNSIGNPAAVNFYEQIDTLGTRAIHEYKSVAKVETSMVKKNNRKQFVSTAVDANSIEQEITQNTLEQILNTIKNIHTNKHYYKYQTLLDTHTHTITSIRHTITSIRHYYTHTHYYKYQKLLHTDKHKHYYAHTHTQE